MAVAALTDEALAASGERLTILTATSGDTGSAAEYAVAYDGARMVITVLTWQLDLDRLAATVAAARANGRLALDGAAARLDDYLGAEAVVAKLVAKVLPPDAPVVVAGDFNDWNRETCPLTKGDDGIWEVFL